MVVGVLAGNEAISVVRTMLAQRTARPPRLAPFVAISSISKQNNLIHGSDGPESADREIALWFSQGEVVDYAIDGSQWVFGGA